MSGIFIFFVAQLLYNLCCTCILRSHKNGRKINFLKKLSISILLALGEGCWFIAVNDFFSVWLNTSFNPADISWFQSHTEKLIIFFGGWGNFFLWATSLGRVMVPSPKLVINLPGTNEKLPC